MWNSFFSANLLPREVWLLPAGFWATDIRKLAVYKMKKKRKKKEFDTVETMGANVNENMKLFLVLLILKRGISLNWKYHGK